MNSIPMQIGVLLLNGNQVPSEAYELQHPHGGKSEVELPPTVTLRACPRSRVVIVVPSLPISKECHDEIILTFIWSVIAPIPPAVGRRVHEPGHMPHVGGSHKHAPNENLSAK